MGDVRVRRGVRCGGVRRRRSELEIGGGEAGEAIGKTPRSVSEGKGKKGKRKGKSEGDIVGRPGRVTTRSRVKGKKA
jgi:hypothetical protein